MCISVLHSFISLFYYVKRNRCLQSTLQSFILRFVWLSFYFIAFIFIAALTWYVELSSLWEILCICASFDFKQKMQLCIFISMQSSLTLALSILVYFSFIWILFSFFWIVKRCNSKTIRCAKRYERKGRAKTKAEGRGEWGSMDDVNSASSFFMKEDEIFSKNIANTIQVLLYEFEQRRKHILYFITFTA